MDALRHHQLRFPFPAGWGLLAVLLLGGWAPAVFGAPLTLVVPHGRVAAWQPTPLQLVVVAETPPQLASLPPGWAQTPLNARRLHGVVLQAPAAAAPPLWAVEKIAQGWQVRQVTGQPRALPKASLEETSRGWQMGRTPLPRETIRLGEHRWEIGLSPLPRRAGLALVGVAVPAGADLATLVGLEPAAGLPAQPVPHAAEEPLPQAARQIVTGTASTLAASATAVGAIFEPGRPQPLPPLERMAAPPSDPTPAPATPRPLVQEVVSAALAGLDSSAAVAPPPPPVDATSPAEAPADPLPETSATPEPTGKGFPPQLAAVLAAPQADWLTAYQDALAALMDAPEDSRALTEARLALAGTYLLWQRPEEALMVLAALPSRADGLPAQPLGRLLAGWAQLARSSSPPAAAFDQQGDLAPLAALGQAVALARADRPAAALQSWPEHAPTTALPGYLQELIRRTKLEAQLQTAQLEPVRAALAEPVLPWELRLAGLARLGTPEEQQGLDFLARAAENETDPITAAMATYEFVVALHQRREISDAQLRDYLTDLQQDWRGDGTERAMLVTLADLADKAGDPNAALQAWQTLVQSFPETPNLPVVTQRMGQAFVEVFDPENPVRYDPLAYLGLYYDFRELLPNDERGDRVQEKIAEDLIAATLYDRAIPILENQLQYRPLEPVAQGRLALLLAEARQAQGQPAEALKVLERWESVATTQTLRRGWALAEAAALIALNQPQAGVEVLAPLLKPGLPKDLAAQELLAEATWQGQDWAAARPALESLLAEVPSDALTQNAAARHNLFRLAYTLGQLGEAEALASLKTRYTQAWPQLPELADDVNAVAASSGLTGIPPEGGPLQALTTAMSAINALDEQIAAQRRQISQTRADQAEYNTRMQYMELLPPPAL